MTLINRLKNWGPAMKAVIGTVGTFALAYDQAQPDGVVASEWVAIAVATVASAVGIFYVVNGGLFRKYAKAVASFVTTALGVVAAGVADGWAGLTWPLLVSAVVKAAGAAVLVSQVPNAEESDNFVVHDATEEDDHSDDLAEESEDDEAAGVDDDPDVVVEG